MTCIIGPKLSLGAPNVAAGPDPGDFARSNRMRSFAEPSPRDRMRSGETVEEQYPCTDDAPYRCVVNYDYETNYIWASYEVNGS